MAYAAEQSNAERQRAASWVSHWASIQGRAAAVLEGCLSSDRDKMDKPLDVLRVEIENEDKDEDLD